MIQSALVSNVSKFISTSSFVQKNSEYLASTSKQRLESTLLHLKKKIESEVRQIEGLVVLKNARLEELERKNRNLDRMRKLELEFRERLEAMQVELTKD